MSGRDLLRKTAAVYLLSCLSLFLGCSDDNNTQLLSPSQDSAKEVLFQVNSLGALYEGHYDGSLSYAELATHGDFGIGTFDGLDGEMILVDGIFHQIKSDGHSYTVPGTQTAPFAMVTFFYADTVFELKEALGYQQLQQRLDSIIQDSNTIQAIKVHGTFSYLKRRSVPKQSKPYLPLLEALKDQTVFEEHDKSFTLAGYRMPDYIQEINNPGYHLHCIDESGQTGGHLLDCTLDEVQVEIDYTPDFYLTVTE